MKKMSIGNTTVMRVNRSEYFVKISLKRKTVEQVESFKDLGNLVTWNGCCEGGNKK